MFPGAVRELFPGTERTAAGAPAPRPDLTPTAERFLDLREAGAPLLAAHPMAELQAAVDKAGAPIYVPLGGGLGIEVLPTTRAGVP